MNIEYAVISDIGKIRKENQDSVFFYDNCICANSNFFAFDKTNINEPVTFAIFDGMGGECCGKEASEIACTVLKNNKTVGLKDLCLKINKEICRFMKEHEIKTMGTTAAIIKIDSQSVEICNIGDSKIYCITDSGLKQLSIDHIMSFGRNGLYTALTQYLGIEKSEMLIEPYTNTIGIFDGDIILICTDGLSDMVSEEEIFSIVKNNSISDSAKKLLNKALSNGGKDNISFIILKITRGK